MFLAPSLLPQSVCSLSLLPTAELLYCMYPPQAAATPLQVLEGSRVHC